MSDVFLEPKVPEEGAKFPAGNGKLKMEALRFMERRDRRGFTEAAENEFATKHCAPFSLSPILFCSNIHFHKKQGESDCAQGF
jgi:hypothetical protein